MCLHFCVHLFYAASCVINDDDDDDDDEYLKCVDVPRQITDN